MTDERMPDISKERFEHLLDLANNDDGPLGQALRKAIQQAVDSAEGNAKAISGWSSYANPGEVAPEKSSDMSDSSSVDPSTPMVD